MTTRTERVGQMDLFTLNSGRRVQIDWGWVVGRAAPDGYPYPEFAYGFQDPDDETKDVELTEDEIFELETFIVGNILYEPPDVYD